MLIAASAAVSLAIRGAGSAQVAAGSWLCRLQLILDGLRPRIKSPLHEKEYKKVT